MPDGHNSTAVAVNNETLSVDIRNNEGKKSGDIFTLVMSIQNITFGKANRFIHDLLNLVYKFEKKQEKTDIPDPLQIFKKVKKTRCIVNEDIPIYDETVLKEYAPYPYMGWIKEGILPFACEKFNIGYDYHRQRVIIPERLWCGDEDEIIGISGRTTIEMYKELDIPKYFKLSKTYPKGQNIYGLNENYETIQETGYVVVFESQKSVLKRYSRKDGTGVAIGNCELTNTQVAILISLNTEIIICLDEGISLEHIWKECDKFYGIRKVSYIYDKWGIIKKGSKDSPADLPNKQYEFMLKYKIPYDNNERKKYKEWQEKQKKN